MSERYHEKLCSREAVLHSFIVLINTTHRPIKIFWIGYRSELVLYGVIKPDARVSMDTYQTHPWVFKDAETSELMHVNHKEVFWPEPWIEAKSNRRTAVHIHFPLRSLKLSAMWRILSMIKRNNADDDEMFDQLGIPICLVEELKSLYNNNSK